MIGAGLLAVVTELIAYRPLRNQPRIYVLTAAIAVSVLLQNVGRIVFGAASQSFPAAMPEGSVAIPGLDAWIERDQAGYRLRPALPVRVARHERPAPRKSETF